MYQLDLALVRAGHRSVVVATEDSKVNGVLIPLPLPTRGRVLSETDLKAAHTAVRHAIE